MMLADIRDYVESLGLADHVYSGKLPGKLEKAIGVYNSRHQRAYSTAIGGSALQSYGIKHITLLVHWTSSQRETEAAAEALFQAVRSAREVQINQKIIKFIQPLYDVQDVGTDEDGVYEMVIEAAVIYAKGE